MISFAEFSVLASVSGIKPTPKQLEELYEGFAFVEDMVRDVRARADIAPRSEQQAAPEGGEGGANGRT